MKKTGNFWNSTTKNMQKNEYIMICKAPQRYGGLEVISPIISEIKKLIGLTSQKGFTLIATKVFEKNGYIKVELALAKGKKDYDKRKKIIEKQHKKEIKNY